MSEFAKAIDLHFGENEICETISDRSPDGRFDEACSEFVRRNEGVDYAPLDFARHLREAGLAGCARTFLLKMIAADPGKVSRIFQ